MVLPGFFITFKLKIIMNILIKNLSILLTSAITGSILTIAYQLKRRIDILQKQDPDLTFDAAVDEAVVQLNEYMCGDIPTDEELEEMRIAHYKGVAARIKNRVVELRKSDESLSILSAVKIALEYHNLEVDDEKMKQEIANYLRSKVKNI